MAKISTLGLLLAITAFGGAIAYAAVGRKGGSLRYSGPRSIPSGNGLLFDLHGGTPEGSYDARLIDPQGHLHTLVPYPNVFDQDGNVHALIGLSPALGLGRFTLEFVDNTTGNMISVNLTINRFHDY